MGQPRHQFDDRIYNNEYARAYRDRHEEDEHGDIREEPAESKQNAEHRPRSTDGDKMRSVPDKERVSGYGGKQLVNAKRPHRLLHGCRTQAADKIVDEETPAPPVLLKHGREHEHGKHVAEDVREIGVHEHVSKRLPEEEARGCQVMKPEPVRQLQAVALKHNVGKPNNDIDKQKMLGDRWKVSHAS